MSLIRHIPALFLDQPEQAYLSFEQKDGILSPTVSQQSSPEAIAFTRKYFKEMVGEQRFNRICRKPDINLDSENVIFTKEIVRKIFVGFLDLQKDDIDEISTPETIQNKFQQLIVFQNFHEIESSLTNLGSTFKFEHLKIDRAKTSGKGFEGLVERVFVSIHHHFKVVAETQQKAAELREIEMLTSRLADREIQAGSVFHLNDGCFYVDKVFTGGGAYVSVLRDLEEIQPPKIVCRGTAMRKTATEGLKSGLNDVLIEIGTMGTKRIWPALSQYLQNQEITAVEVLGKSLGGDHAQELAILIEGIDGIEIKKLVTYCSVGTGNAINTLLKNEVLAKRNHPLNIQVVRNGGKLAKELDCIPAIGGVHIGEGTSPEKCHIEVCYLHGEDEESTYIQKLSLFALFKNFLQSFSHSHCRQTTLENFGWTIITDREQIHEHLRVGNHLEGIRKCIAYVLEFFSLFQLNGPSFTSFFTSQQKEIKKSLAPPVEVLVFS